MANLFLDTAVLALEADASADRHPIAPGKLPGGDNSSTIDALFDRISYNKGGSVIHMTRSLTRATGGDVGFRGAIKAGREPTDPRDAFILGLQVGLLLGGAVMTHDESAPVAGHTHVVLCAALRLLIC